MKFEPDHNQTYCCKQYMRATEHEIRAGHAQGMNFLMNVQKYKIYKLCVQIHTFCPTGNHPGTLKVTQSVNKSHGLYIQTYGISVKGHILHTVGEMPVNASIALTMDQEIDTKNKLLKFQLRPTKTELRFAIYFLQTRIAFQPIIWRVF